MKHLCWEKYTALRPSECMGTAASLDGGHLLDQESDVEIPKPIKIKSVKKAVVSLDQTVTSKLKTKASHQEFVKIENSTSSSIGSASLAVRAVQEDANIEHKQSTGNYYEIQLPNNTSSDQRRRTQSSHINQSSVNDSSNGAQKHSSADDPKGSYSEEKSMSSSRSNDMYNIKGAHTDIEISSPEFQIAADNLETQVDTDADDIMLQPLDILLQFIPYYGQGDPSNDAIVRSTLSGMSVEDIDSKDEYGNTLLLLACQYKCEDLARIMLNKGANPSALNSAGACCLHFACYKESQSMSIAKVLLQNGADPEVVESTYGCTPLHYSGGSGNIDLCKMLLSNGAQVNSADFFSYTCVDYAREARMHEAVQYLQQRLDQLNMQNAYRGMVGFGGMVGLSGNGYFPTQQLQFNFSAADWNEETDPTSGEIYFSNFRTGESLWEVDFMSRVAAYRSFGSGMNMTMSIPGSGLGPGSPTKDLSDMGSTNLPERGKRTSNIGLTAMPLLIRKASTLLSNPFIAPEKALEVEVHKIRVRSLLQNQAPDRLPDIDAMMTQYQGRESQLLQDLCLQYKMSYQAELTALQTSVKNLQTEYTGRRKSLGHNHNNIAAPIPILMGGRPATAASRPLAPSAPPSPSVGGTIPLGIGSSALGAGGVEQVAVMQMIGEARAAHEAQMVLLMGEARNSLETQLEQERVAFRAAVSEREGVLAKFQSEVQGLHNQLAALEEDKRKLSEKLQRTQSHGGEEVLKMEEAILKREEHSTALKAELSCAREELAYERDKQRNTEALVADLNAGQADIVARGQAAIEERAAQLRETEQHHAAEIRDIEGAAKAMEIRARLDLAQVKGAMDKAEGEMRAETELLKRTKDAQLNSVNSELTALKVRSVQEASSASMQIEDLKKASDELLRRVEAAETIGRSMQVELQAAQGLQANNMQLHKDLAREQIARRRLHNEMEDMKGKIRVYVRIRPFSKKEADMGCTESVIKDGKLSVMVKGLGGVAEARKTYDFDQVFGGTEGNSQADVFRDTKHLMTSVIDGFNVCIFAYGQTGAGKSFTMIGAADIGSCLQDNGDFDELAGITPRAVSELFRLLGERSAQSECTVEVSMLQLYRDGLEDLLVEKTRKKKEDGVGTNGALKVTLAEHSPTGLVQVEGAVIQTASNAREVMKIFSKGYERRTTASTQMNAESSRSHLICSLVVRLMNKRTSTEIIGKLTLVDLAGSERVDKSGAAGEVLKEAQSINKSLSALGDVIAALTSGQQHVPYRNHPLTMLMSDSLGGNAKTLMFVNTSPADYNNAETSSSLAFANRCKDITNSVSAAGPGVQAAQMQALKKELAKLKKSGPGRSPVGRVSPLGAFTHE